MAMIICGALPCQARYLTAAQHPSRDAEYAHYLHPENDPGDPGYRRFLSKLADPLLERLASILHEAGHEVALFDPFFAPDPAPLTQTFDVVTSTISTIRRLNSPACAL